MNIILIGPAGSGKGTIAQRAEEEFGWPHISMGELLREEEAKKTAFGKKIGKLIDKGFLVPDGWAIKLIRKRIARKDCRNGFQLDGFPRTLAQAKRFDREFGNKGVNIDLVLDLKISKETAVKRLGSRVQCEKCDRIYNLLTLKPKRKGICDKCGGRLVERIDDRPKAILKRFELFHKDTLPVINYYKKKEMVREVEANCNARQEYLNARREILAELKAPSRKRVFIVHGWGGSPKGDWLPWLEKELEGRGFRIEVPKMPNSEHPKIRPWANLLSKRVGRLDENTYFVGHSIGCQTIMRYLEKARGKCGGAVFVAGWLNLLPRATESRGAKKIAKPWLERRIDFGKVKNKTKNFAAIFSNNDYFVPLSDSREFRKRLGAKIVVEKNNGHFCGEDGVRKLPSCLKSVLEMAGQKRNN